MAFANLKQIQPEPNSTNQPTSEQAAVTPPVAPVAAPVVAEPKIVTPTVVEPTITPTLDGSEDLKIKVPTNTGVVEHGMFNGAVEAPKLANATAQATAEPVPAATAADQKVDTSKTTPSTPAVNVKIAWYKHVKPYKLIVTSIFGSISFTVLYFTMLFGTTPEPIQQYAMQEYPAIDMRAFKMDRELTDIEKEQAYIALALIPGKARMLAVLQQLSSTEVDAILEHKTIVKDLPPLVATFIQQLNDQLKQELYLTDIHMQSIVAYGTEKSLTLPPLEKNSPEELATAATDAYFTTEKNALFNAYSLYNLAALMQHEKSMLIIGVLDPMGLQSTDEFALVLQKNITERNIDPAILMAHAAAPTPEPTPGPTPTEPTPEPTAEPTSEPTSSSSFSSQALAKPTPPVVQSSESSVSEQSSSSAMQTSSEAVTQSSSEEFTQSSSEEFIEESFSTSSAANTKPNPRFFRRCTGPSTGDYKDCTL